MARGRIISPDFWTDGTIIGLSAWARLFYIGTWNFATCDQGHLPDDALGLKLKILPADQVDPIELVNELMQARRLERVEIAGNSFLRIPTFSRHQTASADKRWKTRCPACNLLETLQSPPEFAETPTTPVGLKVEGESMGSGHEGEEPPAFCQSHPRGSNGTPCGPCADARKSHDIWERKQRQTPTPIAPRVDPTPMCSTHEGYPDLPGAPCEACKRERGEAAA